MSLKSCTIFTTNVGRGFCARTIRGDAFAFDELTAAKLGAARFFGVEPSKIEVRRDYAPHLFSAKVRQPVRQRESRDPVVFTVAIVGAIVACIAIGLIVSMATGGAR